MSLLQERILEVKDKIKESAKKVGRSPEDITLVAVTKTVDEKIISESISYGINHIGENRVQDFLRKYEQVDEEVNWHFIGHLQSNKVKYLPGKVSLIHSLDRLSLAKELNRQGRLKEFVFNCLVQVNISGEESKYGLEPDSVARFLEKVSTMDYIKIRGLMTMAPFEKNPEDTRFVFEGLRKLKEKLEKEDFPNVNLKYLSMGMSNDYQIAIEEGSNMVRVGSNIFNTR